MTSTTTRTRKAPAKTTAKAPVKAEAKTPARKTVSTEATPKIRWTPNGEKDAKGNCESVGVCGEREYAITGSGDSWKASVKVDGKTTVIAENVGGKAAWSRCVKHNTDAQKPAAQSAA